MLYNKAEFAKMTYQDKINHFKKCEKEMVEYQTKTKAEMILDIALYLKKTGYVVKEIKNKILEDLGDIVTGRYIDMCLPEEFKPRQMKRKEKAEREKVPQLIAADGFTVLDEPTSHSTRGDREDLTNLNPPTVAFNPIGQIVEDFIPGETPAPAPKIDIAYVESLEQQIEALKGKIGYTDMLAQYRIVKLSRQSTSSLISASKKCARHVYITLDIRTNEVTKVMSDKEWAKGKKDKPEKEKEPDKSKSKSKKPDTNNKKKKR